MKRLALLLLIPSLAFAFDPPSGGGSSITTPVTIGNGGTGQTTQQAAIDALLPAQGAASGKVLGSNGSASSWTTVTSGVTTVGAFSASAQTNGGSISSTTITFGPASATVPGMVSTGAQTFAGAKTFSSTIVGDISGNAAGLSATLAIGSGGTGQTTANTAFNALAPSQASASGQYLTSNGTSTSWAAVSGTISGLTSGRIPTASSSTALTDADGFKAVSGRILIGSPTDNTSSKLQVSGDISLVAANNKIIWNYASNRYMYYDGSQINFTNLGPINVNDNVQGYGAFIDGHFNRNMIGVHQSNRSYSSPGMEYGTATASSSQATVTFAQAFNVAVPVFCLCSPIGTLAANTCTMNAAPSNTAVTFQTSGTTDVIHYACFGRE